MNQRTGATGADLHQEAPRPGAHSALELWGHVSGDVMNYGIEETKSV